jgi:hypothetical protein
MPLSVNGELVDDELIRQEMTALRPQYEAMVTDMEPVAREMQLKEWCRENVVERVLLRQEAMKDTSPLDEERLAAAMESVRAERGGQPDCQSPADEEGLRKEAETRLRVELLVEKIGSGVQPPRKSEIADFYRKNKDRFYMPEFVRCSHIVRHMNEEVDEQAALEAIRNVEQELIAGRDFAEVANSSSDCAGNGGYLGDVYREQMVQEFEDVVFSLKPGERSGIFKTVFGWHIALVHERVPEGTRPLQDVRAEIEEALVAERRQRAIENFLDSIKARATIRNVKRTP